jgi:bla regulator protein blaR1
MKKGFRSLFLPSPCDGSEPKARPGQGLLTALAVVAVTGLLALSPLNPATLHAQLIRGKEGAPLPGFDVASVKPDNSVSGATHISFHGDQYSVQNLSLREIIKIAYGARSDAQLTGGPEALLGKRYDIEAKLDEAQFAQIHKMSPGDRRRQISLMLQLLLADRFHLKVNFQTKKMPVYALILAKGGPKFHPSVAASSSHPGLSGRSDAKKSDAAADEDRALDGLTELLAAQPELGDRPIVNRTGLSGKYDWSLHWTRQSNDAAYPPGKSAAQPALDGETSGPSLLTALQEQLGLKLKTRKDVVETIVIDHLEPLSEN